MDEVVRVEGLRVRYGEVEALRGVSFAFGGPLIHGLLNADPNPGNYLVLRDEAGLRVGFLDFGCCVELPEATQRCDQVMWQALLAGDGECLRLALHREGLVREAVDVLMEGVPRGLSVEKIEATIAGTSGVASVHDLHVWSLSSEVRAMSAASMSRSCSSSSAPLRTFA